MNTSSTHIRGNAPYELRFRSLFNPGRGYDPTLVEQWQLRGLAGAVLGTRPGSTLPP